MRLDSEGTSCCILMALSATSNVWCNHAVVIWMYRRVSCVHYIVTWS